MDLRQIKYFLAVVDCGTFMAAAEHVHVSQPTLSAGIRKLEESLQARLFHRGSRAAVLTPAGEAFLGTARQAFDQLMAAKASISGEERTIRVGVLNTVPIDHLARLFKLFRVRHPDVLTDVVVSGEKRLSRLLKSNKLDVVFTASDRKRRALKPLFDEELMLVAPAGHALAGSDEAVLGAIDGQPFIERVRCESWQAVHDTLKRHRVAPRVVCKAESDEAVLALVAANVGVSIMPYRDTPYPVEFVRFPELRAVRHIGLEVSERSAERHVEAFVRFALRHYRV